jgi:hypothetical protein
MIHGTACDIAAYLKQVNTSSKPIYLMIDHIVYWRLDEKPLSKSTTHPANISKEYLLHALVGPGTTTEMELAKILDNKPRYIVTDKTRYLYVSKKRRAKELLRDALNSHYELVQQIDNRVIFRRMD